MWSSTNQRIKALVSARAREKDRLSRPIHVRRADVVLSFRSEDGFLVEVPARGLLNDFTPAGFCVYAATHLTPNAELSLELFHPKHFRLVAKVVWCQYQPSSVHVLSSTSQPYPYRVGLALLWKDAATQEAFKKFCTELSDLYVNKNGLFIEDAVTQDAPTGDPAMTAAADQAAPVDAMPPPPAESDEGAAPSDEQVAAEMAAAAAGEQPSDPSADKATAQAGDQPAEQVADLAAEALAASNPANLPPPATTASDATPDAASVLEALKDIDPGSEEKKAA